MTAVFKVKPYSEETARKIRSLFCLGNIEYYIQRWTYDGELAIEDFLKNWNLQMGQELVSTSSQFVIYDQWGDKAESWHLNTVPKERFYWDSEGHCLFDLFAFEYSGIMGSFCGYWGEGKEVRDVFKRLLEIPPDNQVIYYSTIWGGGSPSRNFLGDPNKWITTEEWKKALEESDPYPKVQNPPKEGISPYTNTRWTENRDLYEIASKWYIDWKDPDFEIECGRGDLSIFHNKSKKEFIVMALRETEFMLSALRNRGI